VASSKAVSREGQLRVKSGPVYCWSMQCIMRPRAHWIGPRRNDTRRWLTGRLIADTRDRRHWVNSERADLNYQSPTDVFGVANPQSRECRMCRERFRNTAQIDEMTTGAKSSAIDDYLRGLPPNRRAALEDLRAKIRAVVPEAEECISYRMPAFRVNGVVIAGFRATAKGCSYYPFSGSTLRSLARDVVRYDQTKSSLHFSSDKPLPIVLVRKLIKVRVAEATE
jgi:uncharacterized protein YdhG (YjbR/CyaY superfamily)